MQSINQMQRAKQERSGKKKLKSKTYQLSCGVGTAGMTCAPLIFEKQNKRRRKKIIKT